MNPIIQKGAKAAAIFAGVLSVAAGTTVTLNAAAEDESTTITAMFEDASPLLPGNEVKAAGVTVGKISSISLERGLAKVEMEVESSVLPLHKDASATVTTKDLLGERFLKLNAGSADSPELAESAVIPASQTGRVVDLHEVLNAVDTPTSKALGALVTALGEGVRGNGENIDASMAALAPAMRQSGELASILRDQNVLLGRLIDNAKGPVAAMAGERGKQLDKLVGTSTRMLSAVAENRLAMESALRELPSTLASARETLSRVSGVAEPAANTLRSIRPVTDNLTTISQELHRFADAADPALASLRPVLERGEELLGQARPLVEDLRPAGSDVRSVADTGNQLMLQAVSKRLTHLMEFVKGWSLATTDYDAISHYFKAMVPLTPKALGQTGGGPVPGLEQPVPELDALPSPPTLPLPGRDEDGQQTLPESGSVTGLTEEQENSMVGQLLGGS